MEKMSSQILTMESLRTGLYEFLVDFGDNLEFIKSYCANNIDMLMRDDSKKIVELYGRRYGTDEVYEYLQPFIHDHSKVKVINGVMHYLTMNGDRYTIDKNIITTLAKYSSSDRYTIDVSNGDTILITQHSSWYNCIPMLNVQIDILHIYFDDYLGNTHTLVLDDDVVISGYDDLPSDYHITNDTGIDVIDLWRLLRLGVKSDDLIRYYGMSYRVINTIDNINDLTIWATSSSMVYKNHQKIVDEFQNYEPDDQYNAGYIEDNGQIVAFIYKGQLNFNDYFLGTNVVMGEIYEVDQDTVEYHGSIGNS